MKKLFNCLTVFLCMAFILATVSNADARRPLKLRLGFAISTNHSIGQGYLKFAEIVKEKSGGKIQVEVFGNAVLGNDRTLGEAVQSGTLPLVSLPTPALAGFHKNFMVLDLPYVTSAENTTKFLDALQNGELGEEIRKIANSIGLEPLIYSDYGYRSFQSVKKPVNSISDLRGMKIRTTDSPIEVAIADSFGMIPTPIAWSEVYTALAQGVVDSVSNTAAMSHEAKHSEILKYATDTKQTYSMHHLFMNKEKWDALTDEQRKILRESATEAMAWQHALANKREADTLAQWEKSGIKIAHFSDEERKKLVEQTQKVRDRFMKDLPPKLLQLIEETQK